MRFYFKFNWEFSFEVQYQNASNVMIYASNESVSRNRCGLDLLPPFYFP